MGGEEGIILGLEDDLKDAQLGQIPFPIFIAAPVNGFTEIYRNVLGNSIEFNFMWYALSSGSATLTLKIDGTPITGWTSVALTTASGGATATAAKTLPSGSILGLEFSSCAAPTNLRLSLKGNMVLT